MSEATFRSRLNTLPFECRCEIGEVPYQKGMRASSRKERVMEILNKYKVPFIEVGTGTNRFIVKYDGYALKIALDFEGVADNRQEWVMSDRLAPHVAEAWEISKGGHLLVATYAPAFTSTNEMWQKYSDIQKILQSWGSQYLLGDIGLNDINYANWGMAPGGKPVCIDYAYVFPASMDLFECICGCKQMELDSSFSKYRCKKCGTEYTDRVLRSRISQADRLRLFSNIEGIEMTETESKFEYNPKYESVGFQNPDKADPYEVAYNATMKVNFKG